MADTDTRIAELQELLAETGLPYSAVELAALEDQGYVVDFLAKVAGVVEGDDEALAAGAILLIPNGADEIRVPRDTVARARALALLAATPEANQPDAA